MLALQVPSALLNSSSVAPSVNSFSQRRCSTKSSIISAASASRVISMLRGSVRAFGGGDGLVVRDVSTIVVVVVKREPW